GIKRRIAAQPIDEEIDVAIIFLIPIHETIPIRFIFRIRDDPHDFALPGFSFACRRNEPFPKLAPPAFAILVGFRLGLGREGPHFFFAERFSSDTPR
ncbi:MAG TPA: hypothetical protein VG734_20235, partial [Lacunisphaera sp.]|nr:hypothetical protein [Lacunisphaera sp.]